jgi:hypothetical protein
MHRGHHRHLRSRLDGLLGARLELVDASLLLDDGRIDVRRLRVAPGLAAIAIAVTSIATVAAAAIATSTALLFPLTLRTRRLPFTCQRMELGRFT